MLSKTIGNITLMKYVCSGYQIYEVIYHVDEHTSMSLVERFRKGRFKEYAVYVSNYGNKSKVFLNDRGSFKSDYDINKTLVKSELKYLSQFHGINIPEATFKKAAQEFLKYDRDTIDMYLNLDDQTIGSFGDFIQEL